MFNLEDILSYEFEVNEDNNDINEKIKMFKKFIFSEYHHGLADVRLMTLSLDGKNDEEIAKIIKREKSYVKKRKKILFNRFKEYYFTTKKYNEMKQYNQQVWLNAIRENRVY